MTTVRTLLVAGVLLCSASSSFGQGTEATYGQRATLADDRSFNDRVRIAALVGAIAVIVEPPETADHGVRVKLAGYVLREPGVVSARLALVLASTVPVAADDDGVVSTPLTDAQLQGVIAARWTTIAQALVGGTP
jgi:hypothetical protein